MFTRFHPLFAAVLVLFGRGVFSLILKLPSSTSNCDYTDGQWQRSNATSIQTPSYDLSSCAALMGKSKYVHELSCNKGNEWVWVPRGEGCHSGEDPIAKLKRYTSTNKILFVGDSLARNMFMSLRCLLGLSPSNDNVQLIESPFLVKTKRSKVYIDKPDSKWTGKLNEFDVVVVQFGHWFAHPGQTYLEGHQQVGAGVAKGALNTEAFSVVVNTTLGAIAAARFKGTVLVSTYSPSHFFGGDFYDKTSHCEFEGPDEALGLGALRADSIHSTSKADCEESTRIIEVAVKSNAVSLDVQILNLMHLSRVRPDGHPGRHKGGKKDCAHWCLPGVPDTWNQMLSYHLA